MRNCSRYYSHNGRDNSDDDRVRHVGKRLVYQDGDARSLLILSVTLDLNAQLEHEYDKAEQQGSKDRLACED